MHVQRFQFSTFLFLDGVREGGANYIHFLLLGIFYL